MKAAGTLESSALPSRSNDGRKPVGTSWRNTTIRPSSFIRRIDLPSAALPLNTATVEQSDVRLQWGPDHSPIGSPRQRRAIQLGLRGQALDDYGRREILEVIDMTDFVASQKNMPHLGREVSC